MEMYWLRMAVAAFLGMSTAWCWSPSGALASEPAGEEAEQVLGDGDDGGKDDGHAFTGRHLLASYSGCDRAALRDRKGLAAAMGAAVRASGATLLKSAEHAFPGDGMTMVLLLSESHASIHTYPEFDACFVDLFTCGLTCNAEKFDAALRAYLRPRQCSRRVLLRDKGITEDCIREA
jgi:S-adenosylmethionine decarboxylase